MIVLDTGVLSAEGNMAEDARLLAQALTLDSPLLRFYEWRLPSVTCGYFVAPERLLRLDEVAQRGWDVARRPTGGGVVFHLWDMAFSLIVPAHSPCYSRDTLENYAWVNRAVLQAVEPLLPRSAAPWLTTLDAPAPDPSCTQFCMARPTRYDVLWQGKKVAGAAQRKTREGFLHQGTIALLTPPLEILEAVLQPGAQVAEAMQTYTYALLPEGGESAPLKRELRHLLTLQLTDAILHCSNATS